MPRICTVCQHPERTAIDTALVQAAPNRRIATHHNLSEAAVRRHAGGHLPVTLARAAGSSELARAGDLLAQLRDVQATTLRILYAAERTGMLTSALLAIGQARQNIELMAKLLGKPRPQDTPGPFLSPELNQVGTLIVAALAPYPDARRAVVEALKAAAEESGTTH